MRFIPKEGLAVAMPTGGTVPPDGINTDAETITYYARRANDGEGKLVDATEVAKTEAVIETETKRGK